jgi:hypothetical protein
VLDELKNEMGNMAMDTETQTASLEKSEIVTPSSSSEASHESKSSEPTPVSDWYLHECLYDSCKARWSAFAGTNEEEVDLKQRTAQIPIVHQHTFVDSCWKTSALLIQDVNMRQILTKVLHNYQDLDLDLEDWRFTPPFRPLVHRWDTLKNYLATLPDGSLKDAANSLLAFLTPIIASSVSSLAQTKKTGKLEFKNAWQVFPPNSLVMTKFFGTDVVCRVVKYRFEDSCPPPPRWVVDLEYVDWNGETSGYATTSIKIYEYSGYKRVTNLPVYPISFLSDIEKTKETLIERGRKFERLRSYNYMICNGTKVLLETEKPELRPVSGKVCIDAYAYYRSCNIVKPQLKPLRGEDKGNSASEDKDGSSSEDKEGSSNEGKDDAEGDDTPSETEFSAAPVGVASAAKGPAERLEDQTPLSDEQCLMATPWMKGFDLKSKHWCELRVDDLHDMVWNDEAFSKLVLPGGEKDLAWAFVENKALSQGGFDDFIPDKGRGLIILMFGPPGVGKTFTAEAVAERARVPLYSMSAGELGTQPSDVEKALERALELCRMWNAMLLLDEADIFLGARTNDSLARNELVSSKTPLLTHSMIADNCSFPHQA